MAAEGDGFAETLYWYDRVVCGYLGWKDRGKVLCGGVIKVGDIAGHNEIRAARELGASL